MEKLFSFIPENMDKNLRLLLIFLISIQFTSFVLYMIFMIKDFIKVRRERIQNDKNVSTNNIPTNQKKE
jgi:hypothetical protein